jgi:hypothetical protein
VLVVLRRSRCRILRANRHGHRQNGERAGEGQQSAEW